MPDTTAPAKLKHVLDLARQEADLRGDRRIGTDHLLLALMHDRAAVPARALGVTVEEGRAALNDLDRAALAAIGIHLDAPLDPPAVRGKRHVPFNSAVRATLVAAKTAADSERRGRRLEARHLLLALLATRHPDPAADLLTALSVDGPAVRERLTVPSER